MTRGHPRCSMVQESLAILAIFTRTTSLSFRSCKFTSTMEHVDIHDIPSFSGRWNSEFVWSGADHFLVCGLEHVFIFSYIGNNIFQRGRYTTNQFFIGSSWIHDSKSVGGTLLPDPESQRLPEFVDPAVASGQGFVTGVWWLATSELGQVASQTVAMDLVGIIYLQLTYRNYVKLWRSTVSAGWFGTFSMHLSILCHKESGQAKPVNPKPWDSHWISGSPIGVMIGSRWSFCLTTHPVFMSWRVFFVEPLIYAGKTPYSTYPGEGSEMI